MLFRIKGKIRKVMPKRNGVSQRTGKSWTSQQFIIGTDEKYPTSVLMELFGDEEKIEQSPIYVGASVEASFDIEAMEHEGRFFNKVRCVKVEEA